MAMREQRRRSVLVGMLALLPMLFGGVSCVSGRPEAAPPQEEPRVWQPPQGIRIEGIEGSCWNYSRIFIPWGTEVTEDRPGGLLACDGDLLMVGMEDGGCILPYATEDGSLLSLKVDGPRLLLGNEVVSLLASDDEAAAWLKKASRGQLASLRSVCLPNDIESEDMRALKRLAKMNPNVGLMVESEKAFREVLPLFSPRWLLCMGDFTLEKEGLEILANCQELESLLLAAEDMEFLTRLPKLRRLIVGGWDPEDKCPIPSGCERLESLTIIESDMTDLSSIRHLAGLRELHFVGCDSLSDLSALSDFQELSALTLSGCTEVTDLSVLKGLQGIRWLSLPPETTQEQFAAVIQEHPGLSVLELVGCENIHDLSPLKNLAGLETLVLVGIEASCEPLEDMKSLRFLALEAGDDEEEFAAKARPIEEALPQCQVVPVGPICLGSGWILLLFPVLALVGVVSSWARRRRPKPSLRNA